MAYTYPPQWYEDSVGFANTWLAAREFLWYLNGTHPTQVSTVPWSVIDCYDGVTREQPTSGDLSNLDPGNKWFPGSATAPSQDMWITVQAPGGGPVINRFQLYVRFTVFTRANFSFIFLNDWSIGAGTPSSPTVPTTIESAEIANAFADAHWFALIDEGAVIVMVWSDSVAPRQWLYMGDMDSDNPLSVDPRPFVMSVAWTAPGWRPSGADYRGISAVDNTTLISCALDNEMQNPMEDSADQDAFATRPLCSIALYSNTASHRYHLGKFRNLGAIGRFANSIDDNIRDTAGFTASDFRFEQWNRGQDNAAVVQLNLNEVEYDAHEVVSAISVPIQLIPATGDEVPPVVTFVAPNPNTTIRSSTAITIDVTDNSNSFAGIQLRVKFSGAAPARATESIHAGDTLGVFEPFYQASSVIPINNGFRFVLKRVNPDPNGSDTGWPSTPTFVVTPVDDAGNAI